MKEKIKLGRIKNKIKGSQCYNPDKDNLCISNEEIWITKHSFNCGWYWGFGYIGNKNIHTHAEIFINKLIWHDVNEVFSETIFKNNNDFWIFKDLLKQTYCLKDCAETYRHGGHCTTKKGMTDIIQSKEMENKINKDLEKVLSTLWGFLKNLSILNKKEIKGVKE